MKVAKFIKCNEMKTSTHLALNVIFRKRTFEPIERKIDKRKKFEKQKRGKFNHKNLHCKIIIYKPKLVSFYIQNRNN